MEARHAGAIQKRSSSGRWRNTRTLPSVSGEPPQMLATTRLPQLSQPIDICISSRPLLQNGRTRLDASKAAALTFIASQPRCSRTSKTNRRSTSPGKGASYTAGRFKTDNNAIWISRQRTEASSLGHLQLPPNPVELSRCHALQAPRRRCHPSREEI